jgi:hypothetical protein
VQLSRLTATTPALPAPATFKNCRLLSPLGVPLTVVSVISLAFLLIPSSPLVA